jgi:hypothetical protein
MVRETNGGDTGGMQEEEYDQNTPANLYERHSPKVNTDIYIKI